MKKMFLFISALVISVIMLGVVSILDVNADTCEAYTICTSPGEHADSEMNIMWHTDLDTAGTYMLLTKKTDNAWADAVKVYPTEEKNTVFVGNGGRDTSGKSITVDKGFLKCVCYLTDLDSNTEYMYKCGKDTMSATHYFKTGGSKEYTMAVISDYHSYAPSPNRLKNGMGMIDTMETFAENEGKAVDFVYDIGDTIAWGGTYLFWQLMYEQQNFHDYLWAGTNGNHDNMDNTNTKNSPKYFASTHAMPLNGYKGEEGTVYWWIYSDTLFFSLDNEYMPATKVPEVQEWMQQVIDNNPTKYIIVTEHYQWFNVLSGSTAHYDRWCEFFDKNGVDLALSGNHHIYCRTDPLKGGTENELGTMYLETSSSDNERGQGTWTTGDPQELTGASAFEKAHLKYYYTQGGNTVSGVLVYVDQDGITTKLIDRYGKCLDTGYVKAKRETPTLTVEQKNSIGAGIEYYQNETGKAALVLPNTLTGYTSSYDVYDGDTLLASIGYKSAASRYASLNLTKGDTKKLTVKVNFKDETTQSYDVNVTAKQNINIINDLNALGKKLTWNVNDTDSVVAKYNVYCNNQLLGTSTKGEYEIVTPKCGDTYKVEALDSNNKVLETLNVIYGVVGDVNLDGTVDDKDVKYLQKYINGEEKITDEVKAFADVNNDGKVDIQDAAYIKLAKAGVISNYNSINYTVKFVGALGEITETIIVKSGEDATPTFLEDYGYDVIGWQGDYHNVTSDMTIYGIYVKKGK